jgi:tetratricopeptide (TPR) repeat protein
MILKSYVLLAGLVLFALAGKTQPITDAQALGAGHVIETATNSGNPYPIDHFLFPDSLLDNIRQKSDFLKDPGNLASFRASFVPSFFSGKFGKQLMASIHNGNYQLLREYDDKGTKHLIFRMFGDGGLNYHNFKLVRVGDSIKAGDLYTYSFDEWTSSQIARLTDIIGRSSTYLEDGAAFQKMTGQMNRQDYAGVKQTYDQLGKKYQQEKFIQLQYIQACHHIDLGLYEKMLTDYSANFPDAASCYLLLLDLYYSKKDYIKTLVDIDKLDKVVGGDPFLDYFRGSVYSLMNKPAEALRCIEKVYRYDPSLKITVIRLATLYAAAGEKDKARKVIIAYMDTPGYQIGDLNTVYDEYPDLR